MKKLLAILLACAMFLPILASCGSLQAGELDVEVYDAEGNVQNVAFDPTKITGYNASQVTGYQSVPGRNPNYLTSIDTTGGEYRGDGSEKYPKEGDSDPINATEDAQPVNLTGTFDTYYSRETWKYTYLEWFVECAATPGDITKDLGKLATDDYYPQYKGMLIYEIYTAEQYVSLMRLLNYTVALGESEIHEDVSGAGYDSVTNKPWIDFSNKVFVLKRDLDFSKATSDVSYILSDGTSYFNGILDGEGHVIKGKTMTSSSSSKTASMFGVLVDATIKNIAFVDITLTDTSRKGASGLAKWCAGDVVIDNVYFQGSIIGGSGNTGGLVGTVYDSISITNTTVDIEIGKDTHATGSTIGGLIGYANTASVTINNCKVACDMNVDGAITVTTTPYDKNGDDITDQKNGLDMYVATISNSNTQYGGLVASCSVGAGQTASIQNCETSGSIVAVGDRISGAIGRLTLNATATGTISNICSNVDLSFGNVTYPTVPDGQVFCDEDGGLYSTDEHYLNLLFAGMGGIVGYKEGSGSFEVTNCTNTGDLFGAQQVGGIAGVVTGNAATATIKNCINTGNVTLTGSRSAGILPSYSGNKDSELLVQNCKNEGNITATMPYANVGMWCGGIGGYWNGSKTVPIGSVTVDNCFSTGDITSNRSSGGLIGYFQHVIEASVTNCGVVADMNFTYNSTSNPYFGGLVAQFCENGTVTVSNCTVAGYMRVNNKKTAGVVYAGGLIGDLRNTLSNGYFNSTNITELGDGETYSTCTITDCVVNLDFSKQESADTLEVILGLNQSGEADNDLTVNISNVRYIAVDNAATTNNTEVGTVLTKTAHRTIKNIGKQKKQNADGSYSLRYVFGVKNLSEFDVAMGFNVKIQFAGENTRTVTVYCPTLYTSIMSGSTEFTAAAASVDYLFTLVIDNVPEEQIVIDGDMAYIKNSQIDITPFTSVGESASNRTGSTASVAKPIANMITMTQADGDFSKALPDAFADAEGLIPEIIYHDGLEDTANLGCVTVAKDSDTGVIFKDTCTNEDPDHHCVFTANGMYGLRDGTARYHYYTNLESYSTHFEETLDVYDAYYTVSFYVEEDAVYNFCFQLRIKDNNQRSVLIALDDADFDDQFILTYKITSYTDLISSTTSSDATYRDSYIMPFSLELEAGWHTLTFRQPYNFNGVSGGNNMHIRDIYMVKAD